jgi:methylenetetrahydrofolate dehydrogenase (NADP+)/methenyltetrahydrofolate cyclohydrolase
MPSTPEHRTAQPTGGTPTRDPGQAGSTHGTAVLMDGTAVAARLHEATTSRAEAYTAAHGRPPCLVTVLVGDDPASATYVRMKVNRSRTVGIESRRVDLPATTTTDELVRVLTELSSDRGVDGILLQHPSPPQVDERAAFEAIDPAKDVDGVTRTSFARMAFGEPGFSSATPGGIMRLLDAYDVALEGRHAVVIGRSAILGLPVGMLLLSRNATVTYCHSRTTDLAAEVARADLVVAAVGRAELVRGEWIKPGAVVVDAGYNPGNVGDVEQAGASSRASLITPVPGGVGPMTIAVLLEQTLDAAEALARH